MVGVFRRTLSFPRKIQSQPAPKPPISYHIRSISLPCRSHPLITQLKEEINQLKTNWLASKESLPNQYSFSYAWLCDGLSRLKDVHYFLNDILQLPQTQESLRRQPKLAIEKLLEDLLRFVDVYGLFQTSILALKEEHSIAQMALRKRDGAKIALYVKARKKMGKEMGKLLAGVQSVRRPPGFAPTIATAGDAELAGVIGDVIDVTLSTSAVLFEGIETSFQSRKPSPSWIEGVVRRRTKTSKVKRGIEELQQVGAETLMNIRNRGGDEEVRVVLKRMRDSDGCICGIECVSEKVFRALINSRVSLHNTLTQ